MQQEPAASAPMPRSANRGLTRLVIAVAPPANVLCGILGYACLFLPWVTWVTRPCPACGIAGSSITRTGWMMLASYGGTLDLITFYTWVSVAVLAVIIACSVLALRWRRCLRIEQFVLVGVAGLWVALWSLIPLSGVEHAARFDIGLYLQLACLIVSFALCGLSLAAHSAQARMSAPPGVGRR